MALVVDQNVGALDVTVQKVSGMTIRQAVQELFHDASIHFIRELHKARIKQAHQIVVHELKDQVERAFLFAKVFCVLLVSHDLLQIDDVFVFELSQNLDLSHSCDGESLLLVFQTNLLQRKLVKSKVDIASLDKLRPEHRLVDFTVCALADLVDNLVDVDAPVSPLAPVLAHLQRGQLADHFWLSLPPAG